MGSGVLSVEGGGCGSWGAAKGEIRERAVVSQPPAPRQEE